MALMLLAILTFAESFAAFEIRRTNKLMNSHIIAPERPWYLSPFWSWDGVKERLGSSKAWFAILYVLAAAFFSTLGVSILILFWASIAVLIFALGIITPSQWSWMYNINESEASGKLHLLIDSEKVQLTFNGIQSIDNEIPDRLTWIYTSGWTIGFCIVLILLNFFLIPVIARHLKDVVANLLGSDAAADSFSAKFKAWSEKRG